jgi:hypothetical protein
MFNFDAEQIFVVQPRNAGGGIVSLLLSLDSSTANLNFRNTSVNEKLNAWNDHLSSNVKKDAHVYDFLNFGSNSHNIGIDQADSCNRYIHKNHFFELDEINQDKQSALLLKMTGAKKSVGIYLTDACVDALLDIRPSTTPIDFYQRWIYTNQKKLLLDFFGITTIHHFSFLELLNRDIFIDHIKYCKDLLDLDLDIDVAEKIILQWYAIISK